MKLTLAVALQYDNNANTQHPRHLPESLPGLQALPVASTTVDLLPEPDNISKIACCNKHDFYLTYNLHGLIDPIWADGFAVNIYA